MEMVPEAVQLKSTVAMRPMCVEAADPKRAQPIATIPAGNDAAGMSQLGHGVSSQVPFAVTPV
jgi:hypothetical protein